MVSAIQVVILQFVSITYLIIFLIVLIERLKLLCTFSMDKLPLWFYLYRYIVSGFKQFLQFYA